MKTSTIIVAGGTGSRMGSEVPKQFMLLASRPILIRTIEAFHHFDPAMDIVVVLHPNYFEYWHELCKEHNFTILHKLAEGGNMRFHSVKNGLAMVENDGVVAVHDAARPLVSRALISRCFSEAVTRGTAIPALPVNETIRTIEGGKAKIIDRSFLRTIQTPQVFQAIMLKTAYEQPFRSSFTDDAAVVEAMGYSIHLTDGEPQNIKLTHPVDLLFAEAFLVNADEDGTLV